MRQGYQNYQMANMASPMRNPNYDQRRNQYNFLSPQNAPRRTVDPRQMRSPQIPSRNEESQNQGKENVFRGKAGTGQDWNRAERNSTGKMMDNNFMFNKYRDMMFSPQPASKSKAHSNQMQFRSPQFNSKSQQNQSSNQYHTLTSPNPNANKRNNVLQNQSNVMNAKESGTQVAQPKAFQNNANTSNISHCRSPNFRSNQQNVPQNPQNVQNSQSNHYPQSGMANNSRNTRNTYNTQKSGYPMQNGQNAQRNQKVSVDQTKYGNSKYLKYKEQYDQISKRNGNVTKNGNVEGNQTQSQYYQQQGQNPQPYNKRYEGNQNMYYTQYQQSQSQNNNRGNSQMRNQQHPQMKNSNYNSNMHVSQKVPQKFSQSMNSEKWEHQKANYLKNQRSPVQNQRGVNQNVQQMQNQRFQENTQNQIQRQKVNVEYQKQRQVVANAVSHQNHVTNVQNITGGQAIKGKGFNSSQRPNFKSSKAKIDAMFQKAIERSQALTTKIDSAKVSKAATQVNNQAKESVKKIVENVETKLNTQLSKQESKTEVTVTKTEEKVEIVEEKKTIQMTESLTHVEVKPVEGRGVYKYENGEVYEGEWVDGKREGFGILKSKNSVNLYSGDWSNDVFHGQGVLKNSAPVQSSEPINYKDLNTVNELWTVFEGEFKNGLKDGLGTFTFTNGEKFNGKFSNGEIEGEGTFQTLDGDFILGNWVANILETTL